MDEDLCVRERHALLPRAAGEQERTHAHRYPDADRLHVRLDELHRVVDREAGVDAAARRVYVEADVLVGIFGLEMQQLRDDQVRNVLVDRGAEEHDPLVEKARVNIEGALSSRGLLDDHWDQWAHVTFLASDAGPIRRRELFPALRRDSSNAKFASLEVQT